MVLTGDGDLVVGFLELEEGYDAVFHELGCYRADDQVRELLLSDSPRACQTDLAKGVRKRLIAAWRHS